MYTNLQLDLTPIVAEEGYLLPGVTYGTAKNVQPNGEFILEKYYAIKHNVRYSCCEVDYPDLTYYVLLRRRPMFYVFNLILPCVLINSIGKKDYKKSVSCNSWCSNHQIYNLRVIA